MASAALIEAVAVTAELCGRVFSEPAARLFVADLSGYPEAQVIDALRRCRREVRGVLTVQDVVSRINDGRPGPQEAWAMIPQDEAGSVVWTDEMAAAYGVAAPLLAEGDKVAARMAFLEAYARSVAQARDAKLPVNWTPSLGTDVHGREVALRVAVGAGRLSLTHAEVAHTALPAPSTQMLSYVASAIAGNSEAKAEALAKLKATRSEIAKARAAA